MKENLQEIIQKAFLGLQKKENWGDFEMPEIYPVKSSKHRNAKLFNGVEVAYPKNDNFGDYSSNVAMVLAQKLKKNPMEIAKKIASVIASEAKPRNLNNKLNNNRKISELKNEIATVATCLPDRQAIPRNDNTSFQKIEVVKPGYINFYLSKNYLQEKVAEINKLGKKYGNSRIGKGEKIHLDFVSANPTGPVTLGNGRGGTLGDVLANILEKAGYDPYREYYVNDFGNQIKVLGHSILKDREAQYKGEYINSLAEKVSGSDPFQIGQEAAKIILEEIIKPSMEKIGIVFDNYFSEKSLHDSGEVGKLFQAFLEKDLFYEKDGATWFRAEKFGDEKDRVVKKSTGEITYFGTDIAYHKNKFGRGFAKAINVWGADHHGDVKRVMGAVEALGHKGKLKIIISQLLKVIKDGKEFRMSKRKGTYISIYDLLEEVGKDAVRFFFLMYSGDTHMTFNLDLAKVRSEKNPVFYAQYAYARISSILRKEKNPKKSDLSLLTHEKELNLIRELNKFPELVEEIAESAQVHKLPYYAIKLADKFHSFYNDCRVIDEENPKLTGARLELVKAVRIVLGETLRLMGVSTPDRM